MSQVATGAALHEPFDELGSKPPAVWIRLLFAFAVLPVHAIRYFTGQSLIARIGPPASRFDTAFALLLGTKWKFVISRVLQLSLLPESECCC